jgi:hypothetical protein
MKSKFLVNRSKENYYSKSFTCYIKESGEIVVPDEETTYKPQENDEEFEIKFKFRALNHAENRDILSQSVSFGTDGTARIDIATFNDLRLRAVLREWNLVDDENEPLTLNNKNIDNLNPTISANMTSIINEVLGFGVGV